MIQLLTPPDWQEYELIDSGEGEKLERFGEYLFIRPENRALWKKMRAKERWDQADAIFKKEETGGNWQFRQQIKSSWTMRWRDLQFFVKPTNFRHLGIFPEQASIWNIIQEKVKAAQRPISVLNLFGYTGGSTLAAASAGASVTHLDASKEAITWARENAQLSNLADKPIRWIPEDALTFVKREIKRGNKYDAIVMDPPKFGRGTHSEVWKIETDLPILLSLCTQVLSATPVFFIINAYTVEFSSLTLGNILSQMMKPYEGKVSYGELATKHSTNDLLLPNSIFGIWERS